MVSLIVALWLALAAVAAWSTVAFVIATLSALTLGLCTPARLSNPATNSQG